MIAAGMHGPSHPQIEVHQLVEVAPESTWFASSWTSTMTSTSFRNDTARWASNSGVIGRADVIRHERGDDGMVEALTDLESDKLLRWQTIEILSQSVS